jgi:hypothetical protein
MSTALIIVACLFPLTLYCLILALINGRQRPVVVSGTWDFAGVLFAASGLLLGGGPAVLTSLDESWRMFWLLGAPHDLPGVGSVGWVVSVALIAAYFCCVLVFSTLMLLARRRTSSVYNVEREAFEETLTQVLETLGLEWSREGRKVWVTTRSGPLLLEVDAFPLMRHVMLRWRPADADDQTRQEIDDALREALGRLRTPENPAASWFLWAGSFLFIVMFGIVILLLALTLFSRAR